MQIIGMLLGIAGLICFIMVLIKQFQTAGRFTGSSGCHLWYLDLHLGLDECQQSEHQKHHDNLDAIVGGVPRVQSDLRILLRGDNDADKHSLTSADLRCAGAGDLQPAQRSSLIAYPVN